MQVVLSTLAEIALSQLKGKVRDAAERFIADLQRFPDSIAPERYKLVQEGEGADLYFGNISGQMRIGFRVSDSTIKVLHIFHKDLLALAA